MGVVLSQIATFACCGFHPLSLYARILLFLNDISVLSKLNSTLSNPSMNFAVPVSVTSFGVGTIESTLHDSKPAIFKKMVNSK